METEFPQPLNLNEADPDKIQNGNVENVPVLELSRNSDNDNKLLESEDIVLNSKIGHDEPIEQEVVVPNNTEMVAESFISSSGM